MEESASDRLRATDAFIGEKMTALRVKGVIKLKRKLGIGLKNKSFLLRAENGGVPTSIKRRWGDKRAQWRGKKNQRNERVIPIPKKGEFVPLLPLLGALGAVEGGEFIWGHTKIIVKKVPLQLTRRAISLLKIFFLAKANETNMELLSQI